MLTDCWWWKSELRDLTEMKQCEWLEADGLGGFASGTVSGVRTRRYHALLLTATEPPTGRLVLVNGFDAFVDAGGGELALTSQLYRPDVLHPDGASRIFEFHAEPWPRWIFSLGNGVQVQQEVFVLQGAPITVLAWRLITPAAQATLTVKPFFSGRDYHSLQRENGAFRFDPAIGNGRLVWRPYPGIPGVIAVHNGAYTHQPDWYRNFVYEEERLRGLDFIEDLAAPGAFRFDIGKDEAVLILAAEGFSDGQLIAGKAATELCGTFRAAESKRRARFRTSLERAADAYLVKRGSGKTIVAGYPWFTDWGRDTFISLRGLCLATARLEEARDILLEWSGVVSDGMLPNRFPDQGDMPEYNSVDASLWYIVAVHDFLQAMRTRGRKVPHQHKVSLRRAVEAILEGYASGARYGIRMTEDGLLAAGVPGVQLTWMDVKIGDWVVTPRIGKPVEIEALWLNALAVGSRFSERWREPFQRGCESFRARFWNPHGGCLYDVIDVDHQAGRVDASFRPNQIFAIGGLPLPMIAGEKARTVVDAVEHKLWTPLGLRSLAPDEPGYTPTYQGAVRERDSAYHQGTVWPWLTGAFVEAWVRVRDASADAKREASGRFLLPLLEHLRHAGLGHVSEIADADPPHTPRGCPFQAWSLAEVLRLERSVLCADMR
jgi:predicted glycogen debranching enzyme